MLEDAPLTPPPVIEEDGLLVGWSLEHEHARIPPGFSFGGPAHTPAGGFLDPYLFDDEGHLITIAPTGAGKGVSCVIPALLRQTGDLVVLDPKGENYAVTRTARVAQGQHVARIDPWELAEKMTGSDEDTSGGEGIAAEAASINPFDLLPYLSEDRSAGCRSLARLIYGEVKNGRDPFWDHTAMAVLAGLIDVYDRASGPWRNLVQLNHDLSHSISNLREMYDVEARSFGMIGEARGSPLASITLDAATAALRIAKEVNANSTIQSMPFDVAEPDPLPSGTDMRDEIVRQLCQQAGLTGAAAMEAAQVAIDSIQSWDDVDGDDVLFLRAVRASSDLYDDEGIALPVAILRLLGSSSATAKAAASIVKSAPDRTWGSILVTLQNALSAVAGSGLRRALGEAPRIGLDRLRAGEGTSLFLVFPPAKLRSHAPVIRTMVAGLLAVFASRTSAPPRRTLLILDEMAQLGRMEEFLTATTLLRGYGVQVWSFWQDLSQLRAAYPDEWQTVINNCAVFQAFGCATPLMAGELAQIHDVHRGVIFDLEDDEMILSVRGDSPVIAQRPQYYSDPCFDNTWAENPLRRTSRTARPSQRATTSDAPTVQVVRRRSKLRLNTVPRARREETKGADE